MVGQWAKNHFAAIQQLKCSTMRKSKRCTYRADWAVKYWMKRPKQSKLVSLLTKSIALFMKRALNAIAIQAHWTTTISQNHVAHRWMKWFAMESQIPENYWWVLYTDAPFSVNHAQKLNELLWFQDGDLCNVDVTVYHRGFHGDLNETFFVGNVSDKHKNLVKVTYEALQKAIAIVQPGARYREIGNVIQKHVQTHGYSVVKSYCGHGIHRLFHTAPNVPHYASKWTL